MADLERREEGWIEVVGGMIDASAISMLLLCSEVTRRSPIRSAQLSSFRSSSVAKVSATGFCSWSAPTMVTGVPFATRS